MKKKKTTKKVVLSISGKKRALGGSGDIGVEYIICQVPQIFDRLNNQAG